MIDIIVSQFDTAFIIFSRIIGLLAVAPIFGGTIVTWRIRFSLAIVITIVVYNTISPEIISLDNESFYLEFIVRIIYEVVIGIALGFISLIIFLIFQLSGQFFSLQIGFGISQFFDPLQQIEASLIGQFLGLIGILTFMIIQGPEILIIGIIESFRLFPPFDMINQSIIMKDTVISIFTASFSIALKISLPIIVSVFMVTSGIGILARFAPQMNIFILGFPFYIIIGLTTLSLSIPVIVWLAGDFMFDSIISLSDALRQLGGGDNDI